MKNPFDSIKEPEFDDQERRKQNSQFYARNWPAFYCHDLCGVNYKKQCREQCDDCINRVLETKSKPRNTKDKV